MDGKRPNLQTTAATEVKVKVELTNYSYACFLCNHSVRPQLKYALAAASGAGDDGVVDEANLVLNCPMCTGEVYHATCGGEDFRTLCSICGQETVEQWKPWNKLHTACEGSEASGNTAKDKGTGGERVDRVPSAQAVSTVRVKCKFLPFKHALLYACVQQCVCEGQVHLLALCDVAGAQPVPVPLPPLVLVDTMRVGGNIRRPCIALAPRMPRFLRFQFEGACVQQCFCEGQTLLLALLNVAGAEPVPVPLPPLVLVDPFWVGRYVAKPYSTLAPRLPVIFAFQLKGRPLLLKNQKEWQVWCKSGARHVKMPSRPDKVYKHEGWQGYGHWLGTGNIQASKQEYLPFEEALLNARSLKLKREKCKSEARLGNILSHQETVYKHEGWQGYGDWQGT